MQNDISAVMKLRQQKQKLSFHFFKLPHTPAEKGLVRKVFGFVERPEGARGAQSLHALRAYNLVQSHHALGAWIIQDLAQLIKIKSQTRKQCKPLIRRFVTYIEQLKSSNFEPLVKLGKTLENWAKEVVRMWRFTKNNGITEGFHNKMEMLKRRAYGFRNFNNYRLWVKILCY